MTAEANAPLDTVDDLRAHLQTAVELEHATIPPYFTAWASIVPGTNQAAADLIRSVLVEEMLHMTLAANLLNAIGGRPRLCFDGFVPRYPANLPHSGDRFEVATERLSARSIGTFLKIERPASRGARPQPGHYKTIAQFYAAIADGFERLDGRLGHRDLFTGALSLQVAPEQYYGSGALVAVTDLESARDAIRTIVDQGEGAHRTLFDGDRAIFAASGEEIAHYFRFVELREQRQYTEGDTVASGPTGPTLPVDLTPTGVYPIRPNARPDDYPVDSEIRAALEEFSAGYGALLSDLEQAFTGQPEAFVDATARMFWLRDRAATLARTPSGHGATTVGPAFAPRFGA